MEAKSQFEKKPLATARGFFLPALATTDLDLDLIWIWIWI
jgi:hypothetical protein